MRDMNGMAGAARIAACGNGGKLAALSHPERMRAG
jgi:dihydrodipicolinate synthase/N-acetylneuraminate lyase